MEYCLCIRPGDNNLLHIVEASHLAKACYRHYKVVMRAKDERNAFETVADLVQNFCDYNNDITPDEFKAWIVSGNA
ncbi:MAG: hypothetical protein FWC93_01030 [Defluviitaleaceae bacterium]|nr:hypothetical protein [Defluviitaleaceae bacterium]